MKHKDNIIELVKISSKSSYMKSIAKKLLSSIDNDNVRNKIDFCTSLIIEDIEKLLFRKYYHHATEEEKQTIKSEYLKEYIELNLLFDLNNLQRLNGVDLRNYSDLANIKKLVDKKIQDLEKQDLKKEYLIAKQSIGETKLYNFILYVYKSISDELNNNNTLLNEIKNIINDNKDRITLYNMKHELDNVLTYFTDKLKFSKKVSLFDKLQKDIWDSSNLSIPGVDKKAAKTIIYDEILDYYLKYTIFKYIFKNTKEMKLFDNTFDPNGESKNEIKKLFRKGVIQSDYLMKKVCNPLPKDKFLKLYYLNLRSQTQNKNKSEQNSKKEKNNNKTNNIMDDMRNYDLDNEIENWFDNENEMNKNSINNINNDINKIDNKISNINNGNKINDYKDTININSNNINTIEDHKNEIEDHEKQRRR